MNRKLLYTDRCPRRRPQTSGEYFVARRLATLGPDFDCVKRKDRQSISNSRRIFFERMISYMIISLKFPKSGLLIHEESSLTKAVEESPNLKIDNC
jgi:hypothetical protein